jgi:mRNA-degrading endonuclease RelE of RelBE toxin-antitoxin system
MTWTVKERRSLVKRVRKLPENIQNILIALKKDMEINGPIRGNWPNFSFIG